jgi:peptide/nickel transport system substrate-binding protein
MKNKWFLVASVIMVVSMILAACATTTATTAPSAPATAAPTEVAATPTAAPHIGGWLDSVVFTAIADAPSAVAQLQAGTIDMYPVTVSDPNVYSTVAGDSNLAYSNTYGSNDQLILNPGDYTKDGILNPFSDAKIREAMNWAIDRNYVAQEIQGGLAIPKFTALDTAFPDAARYAGVLGAIATKYAYNFDKAQQVVDTEMAALGATKDASGKWQYKGKPVTIIGLTRTEDARKQIGEYFTNQLTKLGFTVDNQEKTRKEAGPIWQGDVTSYTFGFYTAGWINTAIIRDEGINFAEFNSGEVQNIPVFLTFKPSDELKAAEDKLLTNNFSTMDERAQLFTTSLNDSMTESWWGVWVIDNIAFEPYSSKVSAASDLGAGLSNPLLPFTLRINGQEGGTVRIAQSGIAVQAWNPVNGSNWTDDHTVQVMTQDRGTIPDPYTGLYLPKLVTTADVVAKTGLPIASNLSWVKLSFQDSIAVPDDAWADWDAKSQTFITAKDRAAADSTYKQTANVQVTVTYTPDLFKSKWHDGSNLSVADFVFDMIMTFDPAKKDSAIYDEGSASTLEAFMSHFKGVKIVSTDPLTITTWDDQYQLDAETNVAGYMTWYPTDAYLYGTGAWHNQTPAIQAEADNKMAFSLDKSTSLKVDETSLLSGPTLAIQSTYLDQDATSGYIPYAPTMGQFVTADEAKARYANLQAFYKAHSTFWVGTGPYFIDKVDTTAGSITVSKFADYMFSSDAFSNFGSPEIAVASVSGPTSVKVGDDAPFVVDVSFNGAPYPSADLDKVAYTLFAADGSVAASGVATMTTEGQYTIDLTPDVTKSLAVGSASLSIAVSSKVVSMPTFVTYQFAITQ